MSKEPTIHITVGFGPEGIDEEVSRMRAYVAECRKLPNKIEAGELCYICVERQRLLIEGGYEVEPPDETDLTAEQLEKMMEGAEPVTIVTEKPSAMISVRIADVARLLIDLRWRQAVLNHRSTEEVEMAARRLTEIVGGAWGDWRGLIDGE